MLRMGQDPNWTVFLMNYSSIDTGVFSFQFICFAFFLYCDLKGILQVAVAVVSFHMELSISEFIKHLQHEVQQEIDVIAKGQKGGQDLFEVLCFPTCI